MKSRPTYEIKLYLGSINEETKEAFSKDELIELVSTFQDARDIMIPICISDGLEFVSGSEYRERGWKISVINYPKLDNDIEILEEFMQDLASVLISGFKQNIITIGSPHRTIMLERQHV